MVTRSDKAELALDAHANLGEGPCWDERSGTLYWVDILGQTVNAFTPLSGRTAQIPVGQMVGCVVSCQDRSAVVGLKDGIYRLSLPDGQLTVLAAPEKHLPLNRFNDGKCDTRGRLWIGSMSTAANDGKAGTPAGSLYRFLADGSCIRMLDGIGISNGIGWSPDDRTMYYIDSPTGKVMAYDFDPDRGEITRGRPLVVIPPEEGIPDGMTVDQDGFLWVAHWGGWQVSRHDPRDGRKVIQIDVPAAHVTSCAFGGPDLDELYITTATMTEDRSDPHQPHAGGLFRVRPGVRGAPSYRMAS